MDIRKVKKLIELLEESGIDESNRFAFVTTPPYTLGLNSWWIKPSEKAK